MHRRYLRVFLLSIIGFTACVSAGVWTTAGARAHRLDANRLLAFSQSSSASATSGRAAPAREEYAILPGVRLWFKDTGGTGQVVILLHANTGTTANWEKQFQAFSAAGYRAIAFDRRGWGKSMADPSTGPQPGSVAEDMHALVEYLKLDRFNLVGVAGGAFVVLDYAGWHPEKIINMVAAASAGSIQDKEIRDFDARIQIPGFNSMPAQYREVSPSYRGSNPAGTAQWIEIEQHAQQPGAPSQPMRTPNTFAKLEKINVRTLVMPGDADLIAPPALMRLWGSHLPNAEWIEVPDAGHSVAWEQPEIFNSYVLQFLKGCHGQGIRAGAAEVNPPSCAIR